MTEQDIRDRVRDIVPEVVKGIVKTRPKGSKPKRLVSACFALVVSPAYVTWVWDRAVGAYSYGMLSSDGSVRARSAAVESAWSAFQEHPWLGVGIGISPYYLPEGIPHWGASDPRVKGMSSSIEASNVYNLHMEILSETGLAGTVLFVLLLGSMVVTTYKAYRRAPEHWKKSVYAAILVALLGQIAHYTSMNRFHYHYWYFIWGFAIGAAKLVGQPDRAILAVSTTYKRKVPGPFAPAPTPISPASALLR